MADSTSDWDDILRSMDFPPQSQSSPMDVAPANLWCFDKQNSQTPSLVDEGSRIGSPASSPCSPSKLLAPVQEWYLDDQSNFLPALEDDTTELIASPHSQQLQFDMAQMAERLADLENRMTGSIGLTRRLRGIDRKISKLNRDIDKLKSDHNKLLPWTLDINDAIHTLAAIVARSATEPSREST